MGKCCFRSMSRRGCKRGWTNVRCSVCLHPCYRILAGRANSDALPTLRKLRFAVQRKPHLYLWLCGKFETVASVQCARVPLQDVCTAKLTLASLTLQHWSLRSRTTHDIPATTFIRGADAGRNGLDKLLSLCDGSAWTSAADGTAWSGTTTDGSTNG